MYKKCEYFNSDSHETIGIAYISEGEIYFIEEFYGKKVSMDPSDDAFEATVKELEMYPHCFECYDIHNMTDEDVDDLFSEFLSKEEMEEMRKEIEGLNFDIDLSPEELSEF